MPMGNSLLKGLSTLAGIGGLVFIFFILTLSGMPDRQIAHPELTIQIASGDSIKIVGMGVIDMKAGVCRTPKNLEEVVQILAKIQSQVETQSR